MSVTHWRPETSRSGCAKRIAPSTGNPSITHTDSIDPPSPRNLTLVEEGGRCDCDASARRQPAANDRDEIFNRPHRLKEDSVRIDEHTDPPSGTGF